jgi:hypothetical protein
MKSNVVNGYDYPPECINPAMEAERKKLIAAAWASQMDQKMDRIRALEKLIKTKTTKQ